MKNVLMILTSAEMAGKKTVLNEILEWFIVFAAAFVLVAFLYTSVFTTTQVRQTSMQDTLYEGEHLFIEKVNYLLGEPSHGDIVVFLENRKNISYWDRYKIFLKDFSEIYKKAENKTNVRLVKRIIGIPGDTIDIIDGKVYRNGEMLDEPYAKSDTIQRGFLFPVTVPPGKYIVLGDNRMVSSDSRSFGFIEKSQIEGRAVFRFWPVRRLGKLE